MFEQISLSGRRYAGAVALLVFLWLQPVAHTTASAAAIPNGTHEIAATAPAHSFEAQPAQTRAQSDPALAPATDTTLIQLTDLLQLYQLGSVTYAPDGRHIAFTTTSVVEQDDPLRPYTYRTRIWLVPTDGSAPARALTGDRQNASQPAWHPSGEHLAFVRSVDGQSQIMLLSLNGGEPRALTNAENGASSPVWSRDGTRLLFSSSVSMASLLSSTDFAGGPDWSTERGGLDQASSTTASGARDTNHTTGQGGNNASGAAGTGSNGAADNAAAEPQPNPDGTLAEIRAWLHQNAAQDNPRVLTRLNFQGETDLEAQMRFSHRYIIDVDVDDHNAAAQSGTAITAGYTSWGGGSWSADGAHVYLHTSADIPVDEEGRAAMGADGQTHPDRLNRNRIFRVATDGSGEITLVADMQDFSVANPQVSPDGTHIAFTSSDQRDLGYAQTEIHVMRIDGSNARALSASIDRSAGSLQWSDDSRQVYFTANSDGGTLLYRSGITPGRGQSTPTVQSLTAVTEGIRSFDIHGNQVAFVRTAIENPFELYSARLATGRNVPADRLLGDRTVLTDFNYRWLEGKQLSRPVRGVTDSDGFPVEYWIMEPTVREAGETYPLMLQIHGGPSAMWGPGEASMWFEFQYLAARGYGIVYSNPRGSGGYGRDFQYGNYQDWGFGPMRDVLAATDRAMELDWVDTDRMVVTGGSYAGYLTAFIIGHDHRFKAAFAQRGVYDLHTFLGEGNAWRLVPNHFGGYPWESAEVDSVLRANSPMTYVGQIRTPLLIKHGDVDLRTGVIQSEMIYKALKIRGQDVEYVRYPRASHEMSRSGEPLHRLDRILRIYEYFERHVGE